jgi:hypothetical protein
VADEVIVTEEAAPQETAPVNEYQEKYERLAALERYVDALGSPDALIELAQAGHQFRTDPQIQAALQAAREKPVEKEPEMEFYDPEVKSLKSQYDPQISELKAQNAQLQERLNRTEVASLKSVVEENVKSALSKFEGDPELSTQARTEIERAIASLEQRASQGDRNAIAQLESLGGPGGAKTFRMMTIETYDKLVDKKLAGQVNNTKTSVTDGLLNKATDARHTTRAALPTSSVALKPGVKVTAEITRQILERATEMAGKDPNKLWS